MVYIVTDELDAELLTAKIEREVNGLNSRGIQLLMLERLDLVVTNQEKHDIALFGDEDLGMAGVIAEQQANTEFRRDTTTVLKVIRFLVPPTTVGTAALLGRWVWNLL